MFKTKEDEERYNSWTKESIYLTYLATETALKQQSAEANRLRGQLAKVRYDLKQTLNTI